MGLIQGITGGISGKMGNAVFRQRHGETVITQYQPKVANPKSDGQTLQRARFKLVSQLGSILDGFIAIPRNGAVSARNQFAALNNTVVEAKVSGGEVLGAQIDLTKVKLTSSATPFGSVSSALFSSASGKFLINGFGTLAVTNRPERRSSSRNSESSNALVSAVVLEAPFPSGGVYQPPRVIAYGSATPVAGAFTLEASLVSELITPNFGSNQYVVLAYETLPISASTNETFGDIVADNTVDTALAVVQFAKSVNFSDIITSDTIGVLASDGR